VTRTAVARERLGRHARDDFTQKKGDAGDVLCGSAPKLYDSADSAVQRVSAMQVRVQLWSVNQRAMKFEESPLLIFV
jgi:hypothetical protein